LWEKLPKMPDQKSTKSKITGKNQKIKKKNKNKTFGEVPTLAHKVPAEPGTRIFDFCLLIFDLLL
jgi:hypothetical protein